MSFSNTLISIQSLFRSKINITRFLSARVNAHAIPQDQGSENRIAR